MALPASPPISLSQVWTEFGAPAGTPLNSFLRGGAYVPNTTQNALVPTALPISLNQLLGASKQTVVLTNKVVTMARYRENNDTPPPASFPQQAIGNFFFRNDGTLSWVATIPGTYESGANPMQTTNYPGEWLAGGSAGDYEVAVFANVPGNIQTFGGWVLGTYYLLSSTRAFGFACAYNDAIGSTGTFIARIRNAGGGAQVAQADLSITGQTT